MKLSVDTGAQAGARWLACYTKQGRHDLKTEKSEVFFQ